MQRSSRFFVDNHDNRCGDGVRHESGQEASTNLICKARRCGKYKKAQQFLPLASASAPNMATRHSSVAFETDVTPLTGPVRSAGIDTAELSGLLSDLNKAKRSRILQQACRRLKELSDVQVRVGDVALQPSHRQSLANFPSRELEHGLPPIYDDVRHDHVRHHQHCHRKRSPAHMYV